MYNLNASCNHLLAYISTTSLTTVHDPLLPLSLVSVALVQKVSSVPSLSLFGGGGRFSQSCTTVITAGTFMDVVGSTCGLAFGCGVWSPPLLPKAPAPEAVPGLLVPKVALKVLVLATSLPSFFLRALRRLSRVSIYDSSWRGMTSR